MLAQSFLAAEALGLVEPEHAALVTVLGMLERGELRHVAPAWPDDIDEPEGFAGLFNMQFWFSNSECGTVACIGGTAELISGRNFRYAAALNKNLMELFYPGYHEPEARIADYDKITPTQAARAIRNFLTFGEPRWAEVLA